MPITVRCRYNAVNFLQNIHKRHHTARPTGRGMGCFLWVQPLIDILPQFLQWCGQYYVILDCVIMALDCLWNIQLLYINSWVYDCSKSGVLAMELPRSWSEPLTCTIQSISGLMAWALRHDAVARILANGSAAFIESCAAIGWNSCDSVRSL